MPILIRSRWAFWLPVLLVLVCLFSILTLFTYPDWDTPVQQPLAWWQLRAFAATGILLAWLPSGVGFLLESSGFFHQHGQLRIPVVFVLLGAEVALGAYIAYRIGRAIERARG